MTLEELERSGAKHRPEFFDAKKVALQGYEPDLEDSEILFIGLVQSRSGLKNPPARNGRPRLIRYKVQILFKNVYFSLYPHTLTPVEISIPGQELYVERFSKRKSEVQVRCECTDYKMTWAYWNDKNAAHYGNVEPYVRKTTTYPERNPQHVPGYCKHINNFIQLLITRRFLEK